MSTGLPGSAEDAKRCSDESGISACCRSSPARARPEAFALCEAREACRVFRRLVGSNGTGFHCDGIVPHRRDPRSARVPRRPPGTCASRRRWHAGPAGHRICQIYVNEPTISLRRKVLPPQHESRSPLDWLKPLSEACAAAGDVDMKGALPYDSDDEWCNELLASCPGIAGLPDGIAPDGKPLTVDWLRQNERTCKHVFTNSNGKPFTKSALQSAMKRFRHTYGRRLGFHLDFQTLRRTYGSILFQEGFSLDQIAEYLGHSDTKTTRRWYAALRAEDHHDRVTRALAF